VNYNCAIYIEDITTNIVEKKNIAKQLNIHKNKKIKNYTPMRRKIKKIKEIM
jgi:hypothetical protein